MKTPVQGLALLLLLSAITAAHAQENKIRNLVTIEGVAAAKGQPLIFAKRVAWMDAMRTLSEQVLGVEFALDADKPGHIKYTVKGHAAPAGTARQVSAELLPTGIYRITLRVEVEPAPPHVESLPAITAEGKGDLTASGSLAAARAAAKATALAQAAKLAALAHCEKSGKPLPRRLEGHAYYLGPLSERVEGNFYFMTAKFRIALIP